MNEIFSHILVFKENSELPSRCFKCDKIFILIFLPDDVHILFHWTKPEVKGVLTREIGP